MKHLPRRSKSRPVWRITITKDTGEATTLRLYRSLFPRRYMVNKRLRSATNVAEAVRRLLVHGQDLGLDGLQPQPGFPNFRTRTFRMAPRFGRFANLAV